MWTLCELNLIPTWGQARVWSDGPFELNGWLTNLYDAVRNMNHNEWDLDFCIWCKEQCRQKYPIKGGDFITFDVEIDATFER